MGKIFISKVISQIKLFLSKVTFKKKNPKNPKVSIKNPQNEEV